jgi:hypothetical protein
MLTPTELLIALVVMTPFLLIPSVIGWWRGHPRLGALFALNTLGLIFFGIGWILALIWAATVPETSVRKHHTAQNSTN